LQLTGKITTQVGLQLKFAFRRQQYIFFSALKQLMFFAKKEQSATGTACDEGKMAAI